MGIRSWRAAAWFDYVFKRAAEVVARIIHTPSRGGRLTGRWADDAQLDEVVNVLTHEFEAGPGSFLLELRTGLRWDKPTFTRMVGAMEQLVRERKADEPISRWIAQGFWYCDWFVRDWSTHEAFPREHEADYYERAHARLHDLAYWLFIGESPYTKGSGFDPI